MDNLLGVADQVWLAGFWLNSGLQGEARANGKLDTSSLALHVQRQAGGIELAVGASFALEA